MLVVAYHGNGEQWPLIVSADVASTASASVIEHLRQLFA